MIRILLVDDSATSRMLFKIHMPKDIEAEIREASCADEAMQQARDFAPDLVVLDYNLPDRNGVEIAGDLKEMGVTCRMVLLTANTQAAVIESAKQAGINHVVEKPITTERVQNMIEG